MSQIRSTGTKAEVRLFAIVRGCVKASAGSRRRVLQHPKHLSGSPDVYVPSLSLVFFLDGCFFHGCPVHGHIPHTNVEYWTNKISRNVRRDRRNRRKLRAQGFSVWRFWEHELKASRLQHAERRVELAVAKAIDRQ